jgi:Ser/Thr protein kinase RdoA (MazF antagonist)
MIHNDLGFSNVLFDSASGTIVHALLDFDLTQQDIPIAEFNSLVWTLPGHLPLFFDQEKYLALKSSYLNELALPESFARCKAELPGLIDEIVRSRLYEEVGRHWLRRYPQFILDSPDFHSQTQQREELLHRFNELFQIQRFSA